MKPMSALELDKFLTDLGCLKRDLEDVKNELEKPNGYIDNDSNGFTKDCFHQKMVRALNQMGTLYFDRYEFNSALECFLRVLLANKIFYAKDDVDLAISYRNVAKSYLSLKNYKQALSNFYEVHSIYKMIYTNEFHPKLEESYLDLTRCFFKARNFDQAINTYQMSYSQVMSLFEEGEYSDYNYQKIALSHNIFGSIYLKYGHFSNALAQFEKALELLIVAEDDEGTGYYEHEITTTKTCLGNVYLAMKNFSQSYEYYNQINEKYPEGSPDDAKLVHSLSCLGDYYFALGDYNKSKSLHNKALKMNQRLFKTNDHYEIVKSISKLGLVCFKMGDLQQSLLFYESALEISKRIYGSDHDMISRCLTQIGLFYLNIGNYYESQFYLKLAHVMNLKLFVPDENRETDHLKVFFSLRNLGLLYMNSSQFSESLTHLNQALEMAQRLFLNDQTKNHPDVVSMFVLLAEFHRKLASQSGKKRLSYLNKSFEMNKNLYGPTDHSRISKSLSSLANHYLNYHDFTNAYSYLNQAIEMNKRLYVGHEDHPQLADDLVSLGRYYLQYGNYTQSLIHFDKALVMSRKLYSTNHIRIADAETNLGLHYMKIGNYRLAEPFFKNAYQMKKTMFNSNKTEHPDMISALSNLAKLNSKMGDCQTAKKIYTEAFNAAKNLYRDFNKGNLIEMLPLLKSIGDVYHKLGDYENSLKKYQEAMTIERNLHTKAYQNSIKISLGKLYLKLGNYEKAREFFDKAYKSIKYSHNEPNIYLSSCLGYLGLVLLKQGNFSESLELLEQSHVMNRLMYQKLNKGNHIALVWSFTNLGDYYFETRNLSLSLENYSKALNMNKQIYTGFYADDKNKDEFSNCIHPEVALTLNKISLAFTEYGDYEKGLSYSQQAHRMNKALYSEYNNGYHIEIAASLTSTGRAYLRMGDAKASLNHFLDAYLMNNALYSKYNNGNHPRLVESLNEIGSAYLKLNQAKTALKYFNLAFEMNNQLNGNGPDFTFECLNYIGMANVHQAYSSPSLNEAYILNKKMYGEEKPNTKQANSLCCLGKARLRYGDAKSAIQYFSQTLAIYQSLYKSHSNSNFSNCKIFSQFENNDKPISLSDHPDIANVLMCIAKSYVRLGDGRKGISYAAKALEMYHVLYKIPLVTLDRQSKSLKRDDLLADLRVENNNKLVNHLNHCDVASALLVISAGFTRFEDGVRGALFGLQALEIYQNLYKNNFENNEKQPVNIENISCHIVSSDIASCLNKIGIAHVKYIDAAKALAYFQQALEVNKKLIQYSNIKCIFPKSMIPHEEIIIPDNLKQTGLTYEDYIKQAVESNKNSIESFNLEIAECFYNLGSALLNLNSYRKGLEHAEKSFVIRSCLLGSTQSDVAVSLNGIGIAYFKMRLLDQSLHFFNQSFKLRIKLFGENHSDNAVSLNNIGLVHFQKNEFDKSLECYNRALGIYEQVYDKGREYPEQASLLCQIGKIYDRTKKIKNAIANKKTALRIRKALYFGNHFLIAEALNSVGISYDLLGRKHEALNYFEDALKMMKQLCQETDSIDLIISFYNIGHLYCELKDEKKGNEHLEKGNKMKNKIKDKDKHPSVTSLLSKIVN